MVEKIMVEIPRVERFMVEMSGVEKFMVEESGVEKFLLDLGVKSLGLKLGVEKSRFEMSFNCLFPYLILKTCQPKLT